MNIKNEVMILTISKTSVKSLDKNFYMFIIMLGTPQQFLFTNNTVWNHKLFILAEITILFGIIN